MGGGRGAVWNETRNIRKIFFSSPMPAPWNLDTFLWKLGVCERSKG